MAARGWTRRASAVAVLLASAAASRSAAASPEDLFGYGGRTSAMGATGAAHATGYETAWHNPALASGARANVLTLGYTGSIFRLDAKGLGLPGRVSTDPAQGTSVGAEIPVPFGGPLRHRVGLALGFYTPVDVVVRGRVLYPEKTQFPILGERAQSVALRAAVGADVGHGLRVGLGFAALAEIAGKVIAATDATGKVGTSVETQLVATYAPSAGVTWELPRSLVHAPATYRLGLVARGALDARFAVEIDGTRLSTLQIPLFNISGLAQYDPAQVALEVAREGGLTTLAAQVVYKRWSAFPGVLEPTVVCSEGGVGACGVIPPKIDWKDTATLRLGAEQGFVVRRNVRMFLRGGLGFETSPLPSELPTSRAFSRAERATVDVPTAYFDASRVMLTAGVGMRFSGKLPPIRLDLFGQWHTLLPRTLTSQDSSGATLLKGEASGSIVVAGLTAGVAF